jgi:hypothetical protein
MANMIFAIFLKMEDNLNDIENQRLPHFFLEMQDNLNILKMEDDLKCFENARLPN